MKKKNSAKGIGGTKDSHDELYARVSVLAQESDKTSQCPDQETMAALSEGRLGKRQKEDIIAHLNDCAQCRNLWMLVGSTLDESEPISETWLRKLFEKIKILKLSYIFAGGGFSLAMAASLLLFFFLPAKNNLNSMISEGYAKLSPADAQQFNAFISKGEDPALQTSATETFSAYRKGTADGKAKLVDRSKALTTIKTKENLPALLFSLGQWTVLLQCACISKEPVAEEFWSIQKEISFGFKETLDKNAPEIDAEYQPILETIATLTQAITQIIETDDTIFGCDEIAAALENLENHLR